MEKKVEVKTREPYVKPEAERVVLESEELVMARFISWLGCTRRLTSCV